MPLTETGPALGKAIAKNLSLDEKSEAAKTWEKVASLIVAHIVANALVTGKTPANGELGNGKIT